MYDAGLEDVCDAVAVNAPGYADPPDVYYQGGDWTLRPAHEAIKKLLVEP
ncbi:MAG: hypothetical protein JW934_11995 [Anaerolineae bacterium]|nr:hypothetical protein [Anaerolineae bacterium]